jgi:hypothetical protein
MLSAWHGALGACGPAGWKGQGEAVRDVKRLAWGPGGLRAGRAT